MALVNSASRADLNTGQVRVFGLSKSRSSGERAKRLARSPRSSMERASKTKTAASIGRLNPVSVSRQNELRLSVSGKIRRISKKLSKLTREPDAAKSWKKTF